MNIRRTLTLTLLLFVCGHYIAIAQTPIIFGTPNKYVKVLETKDCNDTILVGDITGMSLAEGDRVLIIQMKGGIVNTPEGDCCYTNKTPGSIEFYNAAGNFEFATVEVVEALAPIGLQARNRVILQNPLKNLYEAGLWGRGTNGVQLVKIPMDAPGELYENVIVGGSGITAPVWNDGGSLIGGVVVLEVTGTLTLTGDINVNGKGYRGGDESVSSTNHSLKGRVYPSYDYSYYNGAGKKGEGIDSVYGSYNEGRGWIANGGGGGNAEGAGGGGGGNYGAGGVGGGQSSDIPGDIQNGGEGGQGINYSSLGTRVLMGGGGGGGHHGGYTMNYSQCPACAATAGGHGGGIIIIRAAEVVANGGDLLANGENADDANNAGAGGGGAGGAILLSVPAFDLTSSALAISTAGGVGGDAVQEPRVVSSVLYSPLACFGPGGGGGGGLVWFAGNVPSGLTITTTGGIAGKTTIADPLYYSCSSATERGASQGSNGATWGNLILAGDPLP